MNPETIKTVILILTFLLSLGSVLYSNYIAAYLRKKERQSQAYSELDSAYNEILKTALENPKLRDSQFAGNYLKYKNSSVEAQWKDAMQYEIYAFMCMNFCETIFDNCKSDPELLGTWECIIVAESKLHSLWFNDGENQQKFKRKFREHVSEKCK